MTEPEYTQVSLADLAKLVQDKATELVRQTKEEPNYVTLAKINGMTTFDY